MFKRFAAPVAALAITFAPAAAQAATPAAPSLRGYTNCGHGVYITKGGTCQFAIAIAEGAEDYNAYSGRQFWAFSHTTRKWYPVRCTAPSRHRGTCRSGKNFRQVIQVQRATFAQWYDPEWDL